ncbi:dual specificity protein phosphatase family protein [Pseudomonas sp. R2.Fl]|nr:dual specificity protein phosphatase family protein [Pseudomonas sp. R2.Fl]
MLSVSLVPFLPRFAATIRRLALGLLFASLLAGGYLGYLRLSGNLYEVIPGELYRSAQPSPGRIDEYARAYGIRSILNLRGANPDKQWYVDEVATAKALGIDHLDFRMSAKRELTIDQVHDLLEIMRDAPKPLLIHCEGGADRTGLASVLYLNQIAGTSEEKAEQQLSLRFGHIGIPLLSRAYAMDDTWEMIEKAFGIEN